MPTEIQPYDSSNHHKWLPFQILGDKTVRNVQNGDMAEITKRPVSDSVTENDGVSL